jgi:hypothetical protein
MNNTLARLVMIMRSFQTGIELVRQVEGSGSVHAKLAKGYCCRLARPT